MTNEDGNVVVNRNQDFIFGNNPKKLDLKFYLKSSEQRLLRVKRGERLFKAVENQNKSFKKLLVTMSKSKLIPLKEKPNKLVSILNKAKKISNLSQESISFFQDIPIKDPANNESRYEYTDSDTLLNVSKTLDVEGPYISEAMVEYINAPVFDPALEAKKMKNLQQFFCEKYLLVNECIDENHSKQVIQDKVSHYVKKATTKLSKNEKSTSPKESGRKTKQQGKGHKKYQSMWDLQMDHIDSNIKDILEENAHEEQRRKDFEMKKLRDLNPPSKPPSRQQSIIITAESKIKPMLQQDPSFQSFNVNKTPVRSVKDYVNQILAIGRSNSSYFRSRPTSTCNSPIKSRYPSLKKKESLEIQSKTFIDDNTDTEKYQELANSFVKESSLMTKQLNAAFRQRAASRGN
ncbi:unnamed protein product [Blepharisma stoltei]|uniref:Uncharacterized protein n=1 Tax=Blepharisma stoltei TaxID=1481888 RepID=A0AAU9KAN2_9CILI|nr:unnamed protein product [Blepharisma stoltei]